jgi:hypothetical protein
MVADSDGTVYFQESTTALMENLSYVLTFYLRSSGIVCGPDGNPLNSQRHPRGIGINLATQDDARRVARELVSRLPFIGVRIHAQMAPRSSTGNKRDEFELIESDAFYKDKWKLGVNGKWTLRFIEQGTDAWISPTNAYWAEYDPDPAILFDSEHEAIKYESHRHSLVLESSVNAYVYRPDQSIHRINGRCYEIDPHGHARQVCCFRNLFTSLFGDKKRWE